MTWTDSPKPRGVTWLKDSESYNTHDQRESTSVRTNCADQNDEQLLKAKPIRLPPCIKKNLVVKEQVAFTPYDSSTPVRLRNKSQPSSVALSDATPVRTNCTPNKITVGTGSTTNSISTRSPTIYKARETERPTKKTEQVESNDGLKGKRTIKSIMSSPRKSIRDGGEQWRKHGKFLRAQVIIEDEQAGSNAFVLSSECNIKRYYDVAEKVFEQFLNAPLDNKSDLIETYLIGNRLVKFLSTVLPTHKDYLSMNNELMGQLRSKSQTQLVQLLQYMEQLAIIIDEEEFNKYILLDLTDQSEKSIDTGKQTNSIASVNDAASTNGCIGDLNPKVTKETLPEFDPSLSPIRHVSDVPQNETQKENPSPSSPQSSLNSFDRLAKNGEFHQIMQPSKNVNEASQAWDSQFSQYGVDDSSYVSKKNSASILDASVYLAEGQSHIESVYDDSSKEGEDTAWKPTAHDPFAKRISPLKPPRQGHYIQDRKSPRKDKASRSHKNFSVASRLYSATEFDISGDRQKISENLFTVESHASSFTVPSTLESSSQETPTKPYKLQNKKVSPKSVMLEENWEKEADKIYFRGDENSLLWDGIEPDYPRSPGRTTLQKLKGCTKCLIPREQSL